MTKARRQKLAVAVFPFYLLLSPLTEFSGANANNSSDTTSLRYQIDTSKLLAGQKVDDVGRSSLLITLNERLGTIGQAKMLGKEQVEIHINGELNQIEMESVKRRIGTSGGPVFRYTADLARTEDRLIIEQARLLPPEETKVVLGVIGVAEWVHYWGEKFDDVDVKSNRLVMRSSDTGPEVLVLMDSLHLTGEYLVSANNRIDKHERAAIDFLFGQAGASLLQELTSKKLVDNSSVSGRFLGLLLDNRFVSGTLLSGKTDTKLQIGGFSKHDANAVIAILNAGSLPYPLQEMKGIHK